MSLINSNITTERMGPKNNKIEKVVKKSGIKTIDKVKGNEDRSVRETREMQQQPNEDKERIRSLEAENAQLRAENAKLKTLNKVMAKETKKARIARVEREKERERQLCDACRYGHINRVRELLDEGVDINAKDDDGNTPLL